MQLHMYLVLILLSFVLNLQGAPALPSSDISENQYVHNPERNDQFNGDDIVPSPFANALTE
ncbi:unnamed protein product, partial [Rotaria magnacalcarata]